MERRKKKSFRGFGNEKVWQIADKYQNVVAFNEDFCEWKPLTLTHFTRNEAEEIIADTALQYYKVGEGKEFEKMGWHIVKDKARAKEVYQAFDKVN